MHVVPTSCRHSMLLLKNVHSSMPRDFQLHPQIPSTKCESRLAHGEKSIPDRERNESSCILLSLLNDVVKTGQQREDLELRAWRELVQQLERSHLLDVYLYSAVV